MRKRKLLIKLGIKLNRKFEAKNPFAAASVGTKGTKLCEIASWIKLIIMKVMNSASKITIQVIIA